MTREIHTPASHPNHPAIGQTFRAWDGEQYICDSWEKNLGYWMFRTGEHDGLIRRNVSERAIGATFHKVAKSTARSASFKMPE